MWRLQVSLTFEENPRFSSKAGAIQFTSVNRVPNGLNNKNTESYIQENVERSRSKLKPLLSP